MSQIIAAAGLWIDDQEPEQPPRDPRFRQEWERDGRDTDFAYEWEAKHSPEWNSQWWQGL